MAITPLTPRRSKRFQPFVNNDTELEPSEETISWSGEPILVREALSTDLHEEDLFEDDAEIETLFYKSFTREKPRKRSKRKKDAEDEDEDVDAILVFNVGDTVLVRSHAKLPSVGVIVAMWDVREKALGEDGQAKSFMKVKVHWFLRPSELPNVRARRDHLENEIYFSLSSVATLTPHHIIRHCTISSRRPIQEASLPQSSPTKKRKIANLKVPPDNFFCNSAIDALRGLYYELNWEYHAAEAREAENDPEGLSWVVAVAKIPDRKRKPSRLDSGGEDEGDEDEEEYEGTSEDEDEDGDMVASVLSDEEPPASGEDDQEQAPRTPRKRGRQKKSQSIVTPRKRSKRTLAAPTPHSKAALRARAKRSKRLAIRPAPPERAYDFMNPMVHNLPDDPWLRAMQVLHVGSRPDVLPCREDEFVKVLRSVEGLLEEGSGGCVYISGVPGTGKTATVHRIVRELKRMAERNEANPFTYVEINGLRIPEPSAAYGVLWEAVSGHDIAKDGHLKISSKEALKQLTKYFSAGVRAGPGGHACIVLMDELDQLVTSKQEVVYNFFNWPTLLGSKLVVIAVANTMDLPERVMTGRVRSRLGMTRINFKPYTTPQLVEIVQSRLQTAKDGYSGEFPEVIMPDGIRFAAMKVSSVSGDARRVLDICRRAVELVEPERRAAKTDDVKKVITLMQNSPTAAYLRDCSLHERIMLASLLKCVKRDGIDEIKWDDIQHQHLIYTNILTGDEDSTRKPTTWELRLILDSLLASHAVLIEEGGGAIARKPEGERRVLLNVEQTEVERVLSDLGGPRWKNALGI